MNNYQTFFNFIRAISKDFEIIDFYQFCGWDDNSLVIDFSLLNVSNKKINDLINYLFKNDFTLIIYKFYFDFEDTKILTIHFQRIKFKVFKKYYNKYMEA